MTNLKVAANVHSINTHTKNCIVTVFDGDDVVLNHINIGLELNEDGTANTTWIRENIKTRVSQYRSEKKISNKLKIIL